MNWFTSKGVFKELNENQLADLEPSQLGAYHSAKAEHEKVKLEEELKSITDEQKANLESIKNMEKILKEQSELIEELKESGISEDSETFEKALKSKFDESYEKLKEYKGGQLQTVDIHIEKGAQDYGDIDSGLDFAQFRAGVTDIPVRQPRFKSLFGSIPLNTEFYKYTEQDTVVRDGKNVAKCTAVSTSTKETLIVRNITTTNIKDMIEFCIEFVEDYTFMQSRINKLLMESVALRVDQQILLGTGLNDETFSIDSVSSEFSATNVVCDISQEIQDGSFVDLILGMQTQIDMLGEQSFYSANTVIVNKCDWFVGVESRKDANNNYLDDRVTYVSGVPFIGGMRVLTSPLVPQNTCYVFDSTKGEIIQRRGVQMSISYENRDAWEKEIGYIKAYESLNFLVMNNNKNAFMKCSDVQTAITAITTP